MYNDIYRVYECTIDRLVATMLCMVFMCSLLSDSSKDTDLRTCDIRCSNSNSNAQTRILELEYSNSYVRTWPLESCCFWRRISWILNRVSHESISLSLYLSKCVWLTVFLLESKCQRIRCFSAWMYIFSVFFRICISFSKLYGIDQTCSESVKLPLIFKKVLSAAR